MSAAILTAPCVIERDADWFEDIPVWIENTSVPDADVQYCQAMVWVRPPATAPNQTQMVLDTRADDGRLTIVGNAIQIRVRKADVNLLPSGSYTLSVRLDHTTGYEEPFFLGAVQVVPFGSKR